MKRSLVTLCVFLGCTASKAAFAVSFPELKQVVELAKKRGPNVLAAAAEVRLAQSGHHAAGLPPLNNPYLEIQFDRGKYTQDITINAMLFVPIELTGQKEKRLEEVRSLTAWKKGQRDAAAAVAVGEAITAYGELLIAHTRIREAERGEAIAKEEVAYFKGRLSAGDATVVDLAVAEGEAARFTQSKAESALAQTLAKTRLSIAISEPKLEDPKEDLNVELPALRWKDAESLAAHLAANSPTIQSTKLESSFFEASRARWVAEAYAPVNFILNAGRGDSGEFRFGGGLSWTFPFFRKNQAEVARAEAEQDRIQTLRALMLDALKARVKGYFAAYTTARTATATIDQIAIPAAQAVVTASEQAWKAGKLELSRVLLARRDLSTARSRRLDVIAAGWSAYGNLASLVGDLP